jgi:hypothetical protein
LLNFGNSLSYLNSTRTSLGAVESGSAAPDTFFVVQYIKSYLGTLVARVKDKAVSINDCSWTKVLAISPEHRTAGSASCTQDALGGVIKSFAILW